MERVTNSGSRPIRQNPWNDDDMVLCVVDFVMFVVALWKGKHILVRDPSSREVGISGFSESLFE